MVKVLCLPVGVWKVIFFLLQFLNFGFFIGSLVFDVWFKQRWNYPGNIDSENYKGRLFSAKDHLVGLCDEGDSFKYCYDECRDLCDDLSSNKGDCRDFCDRPNIGTEQEWPILYSILLQPSFHLSLPL